MNSSPPFRSQLRPDHALDEQQKPRGQLHAELRACRRRCKGRQFVEHRTHRAHECDQRCVQHACRPLSVSSVREVHAVLSGALSAAWERDAD